MICVDMEHRSVSNGNNSWMIDNNNPSFKFCYNCRNIGYMTKNISFCNIHFKDAAKLLNAA